MAQVMRASARIVVAFADDPPTGMDGCTCIEVAAGKASLIYNMLCSQVLERPTFHIERITMTSDTYVYDN
jgi:hypothetical protein